MEAGGKSKMQSLLAHWALGPMGHWDNGPMGQWANGPTEDEKEKRNKNKRIRIFKKTKNKKN